MKKRLMKIFMCLLFIAAPAATASAAAASRTIFEIEMDFVVRDEKFPAGKYSIGRLSASNPEILVLKRLGGKTKSVLLIRQNGDRQPDKPLSLRFQSTGGSFFLIGVQAFGKNYALDSLDPRETRPPSESLSFVVSPDIFGAD